MNCADNRLLHSALLDGELAPDERAQVEAHLATCAECTAELAALARTLSMIHALPAARAPQGFVDRVLEATRPLPWHRRLGRRLFQPLRVKLPLEAAAIMLVALGAVYVFQNTPELQQAARQEPPVSAPVPVSPPATPAPPAVPAVRGTPAPSPSAPAEAHRTAEEDQAGKKKEREAALSDAPAKAEAPPSRPVTPPAPRLEARPEAKLQSKVDARKTPVAPEGRSDAREAPPAATNLMKDKAPSQSPAAPPAPPAAAAPPADVAPEAREKSGARPQSEVSRPLDRVGPSESSGDLSARARQVPARLFVAPDASGRLSVADRAAADRALADLGARLGVTQAFRRDEPDGAIIEWIVPREVYAEFVRGLAGIGRWTADREPASPPARVRLQVRVGS